MADYYNRYFSEHPLAWLAMALSALGGALLWLLKEEVPNRARPAERAASVDPRLHICVYFRPFRDEDEAIPEMVNSAQTSESHAIRRVTALKAAIQALRGPRRNMKTSTKDRIKGSFHEVKGTIKEEVGKVTNDRNLKTEGKAEKKAGKVQQRIGQAKEAVAKLKGKLAELKTG